MKRSLDQNKKIWGLTSQLAQRTGQNLEWAKRIMQEICKDISGDIHTSALSPTQADRLITELKDRVRKVATPEAKGMVTQPQMTTLKRLYKDAKIRNPQGFCNRIIKKAWPQTRLEAASVHQALEDMVIRAHPTRELIGVAYALDEPAVKVMMNDFEKKFVSDMKYRVGGRDGALSAGMIGKLMEIYRKYGGVRCGANG